MRFFNKPAIESLDPEDIQKAVAHALFDLTVTFAVYRLGKEKTPGQVLEV